MERRPLDARALADREEIRDILARYARAIDRLDVDLLKSCYHPDSYDDHGHFKGNGHEFADFIIESLRGRCHATSHVVTNILVELDPTDHDRATGESYATSTPLPSCGGSSYPARLATKPSRGISGAGAGGWRTKRFPSAPWARASSARTGRSFSRCAYSGLSSSHSQPLLLHDCSRLEPVGRRLAESSGPRTLNA